LIQSGTVRKVLELRRSVRALPPEPTDQVLVDELVALWNFAKNLQMGLILGPVGVFNAVVAHYAAANPAAVAHYRLTISTVRSVGSTQELP
jgi:hypothetical protein